MRTKLKELREKRKMTQEELANTSGVSRTTIANIERGVETSTTIGTIAKLAEALGVTPAKLLP